MKKLLVLVALVVVLGFLVVGCQQKTVLLVSPELSELSPVIGSYLEKHPSAGNWQVSSEENAWPSDALVVRLTTTPNANLPSGASPTVFIPETAIGSDFVPPSALLRLARTTAGWEALPLFFDIWGQTRFDPIDLTGTFPLSWDVLISQAKKSSVIVAGSRPSFRQWVLEAGSSDPTFHFSKLGEWFSQSPEKLGTELLGLRKLRSASFWVDSTWSFAMADLRQSYMARSPLVFLETFRDFENVNTSGSRRFFPFQKGLAGGSVAVGGLVVFVEIRSTDPEAWRTAQPLMKLMTTLDFQKEVGSKTHWLAANLNVPELDGTGSAARSLVTQAQVFLPLSDRLPLPLVEGNLFVEAQLAVDHFEP